MQCPLIVEGYAERSSIAESWALAKSWTRLPLSAESWGLCHPLAVSCVRCCHVTDSQAGGCPQNNANAFPSVGGWVLNLAVGEGKDLHLTGSSLKSGTFEISGSTNSSVNAKNMSGINLLSLVRDIIGTA